MESASSSVEILACKDGSQGSLDLQSTDSESCRKSHDDEKSGNFTLSMQNIQEKINTFFKKNERSFKMFKNCTLYGICVLYFSWATYYFINEQVEELESSLCSGYGFLMVLFIILNIFIVYYVLLKSYIVWCNTKFRIFLTSFQFLRKRTTKIFLYLLLLTMIIGYLIYETSSNLTRLMSLSGLAIFLIIGFLFSKHQKEIDWHPVIWGLLLQFVFGLLTLRWKVGRSVFECIGNRTVTFLDYAKDGAAFVYGDFLVYKEAVFVFQALSTIYLLSLTVNVLYHYGIMQKIILFLGEFLARIMGTTICESVNSAANIFLGMTEAPLIIKPYLESLTASEIHSVMAAGFASVSGTVLAAYISLGASASHLITSSIMSAPAALCYSKLIYPEIEKTIATKETIKVTKSEYTSALDAASKGAMFALEVILGISANIIAFVSVVYFGNGVLTWMGRLVGYSDTSAWTIERFVGYVFMPISYIMGVPWEECEHVGKLIGIKSIVNEFVAFKSMGEMILTPRTKLIATYAICGFSNPASIGMMISTFSALIPAKRAVIIDNVFRAYMTGMIVCFMTACIAAVLVPEDEY